MTTPPRAWILCTGEPLPTDPGVPRLLRAGMLSDHLVQAGFQVDRWASNFHHTTKTWRSKSTQPVTLAASETYRIHLLPSSGYHRHVSLARIRDHWQIGKAFSAEAPKHPQPDILIISMPTIDLAYAGARYAAARGIPFILDLRDLWPEIFYMDRPAPIRQLVRLLTAEWSRQLNWALKHASAVVGITDAFVDWGCARSGRIRLPGIDLGLPLAYPTAQPPTEAELAEQERLTLTGDLRPDLFQVCFLGSLSMRMDLETLCKAVAQRNEASYPPLHLVIAGSGEMLDHLKRNYGGLNIRFLGRVNQSTLRAVLRTSKVGVVPYKNSVDFQMSIPNKAIEYLAFGLPVLTCLNGVLADLIRADGLGSIYEEGETGTINSILDEYVSSPELVGRTSINASVSFLEKFSTEVIFKKFKQLILSILSTEVFTINPRKPT